MSVKNCQKQKMCFLEEVKKKKIIVRGMLMCDSFLKQNTGSFTLVCAAIRFCSCASFYICEVHLTKRCKTLNVSQGQVVF